MSDEESSDVAFGLGALIAAAFFSHMVIAGVMALPNEEREATPFFEAIVEVAPFVWGAVLTVLLTVFVLFVTVRGFDYLLTGALRDDLGRWFDE